MTGLINSRGKFSTTMKSKREYNCIVCDDKKKFGGT
jgi:hypothetical protein